MYVWIYDVEHPTDGVNDRTQVDRFIAGVLRSCSSIVVAKLIRYSCYP